MARDILIIIPTYEETENILSLLQNLFSLKLNISILIVDDNSPDGTSNRIKELQNVYKNLYLLTREKKSGLGSAYIAGFNYALRSNFDIIIQMDADLSHPPSAIPFMVSLLKEYDLVIGSRYVKGARIKDWQVWRRLLSIGANKLARIVLKIPVYDITSGFKCIKKEVLEKIDFSTIISRGYAFQIETTYRAFQKGLRIVEYPILFQGRKNKRSKISISIIAEAFLKTIFLPLRK